MLLREFFTNTSSLIEGGNVRIGDVGAERIDLKKIPRNQITPIIDKLLHSVDAAYRQKYKAPLWDPELLKSKEFLSGSAFHFLNVAIPDEKFVKVKPSVGDIDTMVDKNKKDQIEKFLDSISGKQIGPAKCVGYKPSIGQFITLWEFSDPPVRVQIDLELSEFDGKSPSEWAKFSHSSSWDDLEAGVKGVFHKYLLRAFTTNTLKDRYVQLKTKLKKVRSTDVAFSVGLGMREKYKPVIDPDTGDIKQVDGLPVYTEIPTTQSNYVTNVDGMFELVFGHKPDPQEKTQFGSFTGGLQLINKYFNDNQKRAVLDGFVNTLYGPGAQALYRGDPDTDKKEKEIALNTMLKTLGVKPNTAELNSLRNTFYANYRPEEEPLGEDEEVKASPRQAIQHLEQMKDLEFINFIKNLKTNLKGKLDNVKMTLKVDGLGARFGKDQNGRPYFESSGSGPIFTAGTFTSYAKKHGFEGRRLNRAEKYDEIFNLVIHSKFMQQLPKDTKVVCEILYNPLADEVEGGLRFATVAYDKKALGKVMTIVPFYVEVASTGEKYPESEQIKDMLVNIGEENGIKFVDDRLLPDASVNVTGEIDPLLTMVNDQFIAKLTSRSKSDVEEKQQLKALIQTVKDSLANYLLTHPGIAGKDNLGKDIEGIILHRDKESPLKITTPKFKQDFAAKKAKYATK